jgi:hypothetical protein
MASEDTIHCTVRRELAGNLTQRLATARARVPISLGTGALVSLRCRELVGLRNKED